MEKNLKEKYVYVYNWVSLQLTQHFELTIFQSLINKKFIAKKC